MIVTRNLAGVVAAAAMLVAGGGAAVAGAASSPPEARCEARLLARIDAAERAGRISPERAARLRDRVDGVCASRPRARIATFGMLKAAAAFLGLDRDELREQLPGTSLAALATTQGKSVADLKEAMVAPGEARLARAVAAGKITQARADTVGKRLDALADRLATKVFPTR